MSQPQFTSIDYGPRPLPNANRPAFYVVSASGEVGRIVCDERSMILTDAKARSITFFQNGKRHSMRIGPRRKYVAAFREQDAVPLSVCTVTV